MASYILLVFEGRKTEPNIVNSLGKFYINDQKTILKGVYGGDIYSLYHKIKADKDLDLFLLLKERNKDALQDIGKDEVSEIYLFFDYDGHAPAASDEKLKEMLEIFSEETETGKLYISYPMVEAIRHLRSDTPFELAIAKCKENIGYKKISHEKGDCSYRHIDQYKIDHWNEVINEHCKKLNHLMTDSFSFPSSHFTQLQVLDQQLIKHIQPKSEVAVLCAFPVFILDYYGTTKLNLLLNPQPPINND